MPPSKDVASADPDLAAAIELGEILISSVLNREPTAAIQDLIKNGAPLWYQDDSEGGISALHAAAFVEDVQLVKILLEGGAIWNAIDSLGNTAADIALSMNDEEIYTLIRDAGIRSEMLLTLLSSRSSLTDTPSSLVLKSTDTTAAASTEAFLSSRLAFMKDDHGQDICLVDAGEQYVGVMMGWEKNIMEETVRKLSDGHPNAEKGLKVLNIGFGLGIIDNLFEALSTPPSLHVIVEAHPDVLQYMDELGWNKRPNVKVLKGRWQDVLQSEEILGAGGFDVIYTDTFSEDYMELRRFFDLLPDLLDGPESRFSFFNGLGATNALFYDVYTHLSELHLADVGLDVRWNDVMNDISSRSERERWGNTREYFTLPLYRLPVAQMTTLPATSTA